MCPGCIGIVALMAASATLTGGMTALIIKKLRANPNPYNQHEIQAQGEGCETSTNRVIC